MYWVSEKIHKSNDQRYMIKNKINTKYLSDLKEEKIYSSNIVTHNFVSLLENGKCLYTFRWTARICIWVCKKSNCNNYWFIKYLLDYLFLSKKASYTIMAITMPMRM